MCVRKWEKMKSDDEYCESWVNGGTNKEARPWEELLHHEKVSYPSMHGGGGRIIGG
jgi:hypothetical protein